MYESFNESVLDIAGLTEYVPLTLPQWFRERLDDWFYSPDERSTDGDLVKRFVVENGKGGWLGGWGLATISDNPVFIFEFVAFNRFAFFDPAELAELFGCGLVFVEPSDRFAIGATLYFTEHRQCAKRKGACVGAETRGALPSGHPCAAANIASASVS